MQQGDPIPDVTLTDAEGRALSLASLGIAPLVVYFYPKDDTSGCTREAQDFTAAADAFDKAGVTVIGVSKDSPKSHLKFAAKYDLSVRLGSDEDGSVTQAFGVWGEKKMYGKTYMGIERATFLFDANGRLAESWRKVKVPGHVDAVLDAAAAL